MAHVDRELINLCSIFKPKDGIKEYNIKTAYCRFNLKYESMLSVLTKVDYKLCINYVLENYIAIDGIDLLGMKFAYKPYPGFHVIINHMQSDNVTFVIMKKKFSDLPKWLFIISVIGNALAYKFKVDPPVVDIAFHDIKLDAKTIEMYNSFDLSKMRMEIPQFTINQECWGKSISEMKVDDFEIWNYYYDEL